MSENVSEDSFKITPNASTITQMAEKFPCVHHFCLNLTQGINIETKHVGESFSYHESVYKNKLLANYGLYMIYFIRKHISQKYGVPATDSRTEIVLKKYENSKSSRVQKLINAIARHYEIYKDSSTKALDIERSAKIVSLAQTVFFHDPLPKMEFYASQGNLIEIIKYLDNLKYKSVLNNPALGCRYFCAGANFIFDESVMFLIRTSSSKSWEYVSEIMQVKFFRHILYSFGYYKLSGKKILKFVIYNPLLGYEYTMELNDIDYMQLEEALNTDVTKFQEQFEKKETESEHE